MRLSLKVLAAAGAVVFLGTAVHCGKAPNTGKRSALPGREESSNKRLPRASVIAPPSQPARDLLNSLLGESTSGLKGFSVDFGARWNLFCNRLAKISTAFAASVLESALGAQSPIVESLVSGVVNNFEEGKYYVDTYTAANLDAKSRFQSITTEMGAVLEDARQYFERVGTVTLDLASDETQKGIQEALVEFFSRLVMDPLEYWQNDSKGFLPENLMESLESFLDQLEPEQALKISELLWGAIKKFEPGKMVTSRFLKPAIRMTLKYVAQQEPTLRIRQEREFEVKMDGSLVLKGAAPPLQEPRWLDDFGQRVLYMYNHFQSEVEEVVGRVTDELAFQKRVIDLLVYPGIYTKNFIPNQFFMVDKVRNLGRQLSEFGVSCHQMSAPINHHLSKHRKIYQEGMRRLKDSLEEAAPLSEWVKNGDDIMDYLRAYYPDLPEDD